MFYNYKYYSEPEPNLDNRRLFCPRGKMIGGCSAHNGMVTFEETKMIMKDGLHLV